MSPQDSHYNVGKMLWNGIFKEVWIHYSGWLYGSSGTGYSPQIPSTASWNMCFVCILSDASSRCKCVHFHLRNLKKKKNWLFFFFFLPYYQLRKEQTGFNLSGGSGSWKHFTIREQVWYPSGSQDPERQCCQKKKSNVALFAIPTPISHHRSNFFFLILSLRLWLFLLLFFSPLPPFHLLPVNPREST